MQSVRVENGIQPGQLCVTCFFIEESDALGCDVDIHDGLDKNTVVKQLEIFRNGMNNAAGCCEVEESREYILKVYDRESNGNRSSEPAVEDQAITVTVKLSTGELYILYSSTSISLWLVSTLVWLYTRVALHAH